ncbi:MAG TPA: hypothetical protein VFU21_20495, partial [Kofleriaceae bacterium]|nr:hypothetical protein [Kofleriaceae bacterium]
VRVARVTTDASSQPYLGLIGPGAEELMFRFDGTRLASPFGRSAVYLDDVQVWWQVVSEGDTLHFQTSIDGIVWSELDSGPPGFAFDAVQFEVGINVDDAGDAKRGEFAIDDLDLPPCGT